VSTVVVVNVHIQYVHFVLRFKVLWLVSQHPKVKLREEKEYQNSSYVLQESQRSICYVKCDNPSGLLSPWMLESLGLALEHATVCTVRDLRVT